MSSLSFEPHFSSAFLNSRLPAPWSAESLMSKQKAPRWALFFSGVGSNMQAILKSQPPKSPFLVCNRTQAPACQVAKAMGYETYLFLPPHNYQELNQILRDEQVEFIFLLGFMKILPPEFVQAWEERLFNLHPSLLPQYPGLDSIRRAYERQDAIGVSIHRVTEGIDQGEILMQECVFGANESKDLSLAEVTARVHEVEHFMVTHFFQQMHHLWQQQHGTTVL